MDLPDFDFNPWVARFAVFVLTCAFLLTFFLGFLLGYWIFH